MADIASLDVSLQDSVCTMTPSIPDETTSSPQPDPASADTTAETTELDESSPVPLKKSRTSRQPLPLIVPSLTENRPKRERKEKVVYDPSGDVEQHKRTSRKSSEAPLDGAENNEVRTRRPYRKRKHFRESSADPGDRLDYSKVPKGWSFKLLDEYEPFMIEHEGLQLEYYLCKRCKGPGLYPKRTTTYEMKRHAVRCISGNPERRYKKVNDSSGTSSGTSSANDSSIAQEKKVKSEIAEP
uniref:BED-type domain-containing protein n=1 Tax=Panagrellus redivivus TaxID=6233 RepID=A0A7E4VRW0_PANRE